MSVIKKWQKALPLTIAAVIFGLFAYGASHTIAAVGDIQQSHSGNVVALDTSVVKNSFDPESPICNPLGCAACGGCVTLKYEQTVTPAPDPYVQTGEF